MCLLVPAHYLATGNFPKGAMLDCEAALFYTALSRYPQESQSIWDRASLYDITITDQDAWLVSSQPLIPLRRENGNPQ